MKKKRWLSAVVFAAFLSSAGTVTEAADNTAENTDAAKRTDAGPASVSSAVMDEYSMGDVVVTAQRVKKTDTDTPASTTVLTAEQLHAAGYRSLYEVLDDQIGMADTSYGGGQDFGMQSGSTTLRGFERGALVLVNGVPMNLRNSSSLENIPLSMVERIEIVRGANSTLYGGEAVGGVINILLKKPSADGHGSVAVTAGNAAQKTEVIYQDGRLLLDMSREWTKGRSHSNAFGPDKVSWTDYWVGKGQKNHIGLTAVLNDALTFHYNYTEGTIQRGGTQYRWSGNVFQPSGTIYDQRYDDYRQTADITYEGKNDHVKALLGYNWRKVEGSDYVKHQALDSNGTYDGLIFDVQKSWQLNPRDLLLGGYSFKHESGDNTSSGKSTGRSSNALYTAYTHQFNDRFTATLGLRGELIDDDLQNHHVFLPQFQTNYKLGRDAAWYVNIGKAFQMPDLDPAVYDTLSGSLKPEQGWNYETGLKIDRGDSSWRVALYHMDMSDKLGWKKNAATQRYYLVNKGDFRNTGLEVEYKKRLNSVWSYRIGGSISNPEVKDPSVHNQWTQDSARLEGILGVDYQQAKWKGNLSLKYLGDREYYDVTASGRGVSGQSQDVPATVRLDLAVGYQCDANNELTLCVDNLLDREIYADRYGDLELGRSFRMTFIHKF